MRNSTKPKEKSNNNKNNINIHNVCFKRLLLFVVSLVCFFSAKKSKKSSRGKFVAKKNINFADQKTEGQHADGQCEIG